MLSGSLSPLLGWRSRQPDFTLEVVPCLVDLEALRAEWLDLYHRCPNATPFQSPAWLVPWARQFAPDRTQAIAARRGCTLVALVPFFAWEGSVLLAGTGPTDYVDGLFATDGGQAATAVLAAIAAVADEISCKLIDLQQLRPASMLLNATTPRGWRDAIEDGVVCPVTQLCGENGLGKVSPRLQKNLAQARRRIDSRRGRCSQMNNVQDCHHAAQLLERLHASRWEQRGETGVLSAGLMRGLVREALGELSLSGMLRFHTLDIEDHTIAALFALQGHHAVYYYLSGFDPDWSRISPGMVMIATAMNSAAREGAREFHFLRGRESYKYRFGAEDRPTLRRILSRPH